MQRKLLPYLHLTSVTILLFSTILHADTTWVAGEVYGTWTRDGNPYLVTDTLIVPLDSTLNIQPGVQIWFLDQEIRRTPILVHGMLRAIGSEGDSVYFYSPVAGFGGIWNDYTPNTEIRLEYCVIDSIFGSISGAISSWYGLVVMEHSRIVSCFYLLMYCLEEIDTVQYCLLQSHGGASVEFQYGGPVVFRHNQGSTVSFGTYFNLMAPVFDNHLGGISIDGGGGAEIYDNEVAALQLNAASAYIHDCQIGPTGFQAVTSPGFTFEQNVVAGSSTGLPVINVIDYSQGVVRDNVIYGQAKITNSSVTFEGNLVVNQGYGIKIMLAGSTLIQSNTLVFSSKGIYCIGATGNHQIIDNIFMGDAVNCTGVYGSTSAEFNIRYNDFFQVNSVTYQCQLDSGNIFLDPRFRAGDPYDYQLQANSACIDAGDPTSPLDPDGTRADMGCYFFDHRIDNFPAIISPVEVNVERGTTLRYVARATDDFGPLKFGFWNLPGWLHRVNELMDFEEKIAVVSGRVPQGQENFTFGVWVEDGRTQRDSQEVFVLVSQYTILAGEVTGVLTREQSPYMVVEDVVVPAGDSLRIEPGVEIRFQWEPVEDLRHRILVRGKLNAIGTPEDTIYFLPEFGDSLAWAWRGVQCIGASLDTSRIRFAHLSGSYYAVTADSQASMTVEHLTVVDARYSLYSTHNGWLKADSSAFLVYHPNSNFGCCSEGGSLVIRNSVSEFFVPYLSGSHLYFRDGAQAIVHGCTFIGEPGSWVQLSSHVDFIRNRLYQLGVGIGYESPSSGTVANSIFSECGDGIMITPFVGGTYVDATVTNNVFFRTGRGIYVSGQHPDAHIGNDIFLGDSIGIQCYSGSEPFPDIGYNDFFDNDSDFVNCLVDSTNLFVDPLIQDTLEFRLSYGSPCIDAGDPDPFFNDVDSTRNDIGCWGGPWGESYPYVPVLSYQPKPLPTEFALLPPYPNPFNSVLVISFTLPVEKEVKINVYNILGQKVQDWTLPPTRPGVHRIIWDSGSCASGLYIIQLIAGGKELRQKALLIK